jgi:2-oxoglutarate ferredoxin oxidoreductase subunit alpha
MNTTEAAAAAGGRPRVSTINEAVIRNAGNSQDGIQAIGGFLARLAGRTEQEVMTFMTIPSTISGGPSIFQVRIGSGEVLSAGDEADVLLAFYQHSYDGHLASLRPGGLVLYDTDHVQPNPEMQGRYRHVGIPISTLTIEAIGGTAKDKGKNVFALGLLARMFDLDVPKLEELITERFKGKDESVLKTAMAAFHAGYGYTVGAWTETYRFAEARHRSGRQVVMNGNEALAYGVIAAGVRFGAAYPITPGPTCMGDSAPGAARSTGGLSCNARLRIAAISMANGASFAGRVAVTGSSGPGISLKKGILGLGGDVRGAVWHQYQRVGPFDRSAHPGGAVGPEPGGLRQSWGCSSSGAGAGGRRGLFLHGDRSGEHRAEVQCAGVHPQRPGHCHPD